MRNSKPTATYIDDLKGAMLVRTQRGHTIAEALKFLDGSSGFCELCWRQTEYAERQLTRYRRKPDGAVEEIQEVFPDADSASVAERILDIFKLALSGEYSKLDAGLGFEDVLSTEGTGYIAPRIIMMIGIGKFTQLRTKYSYLCEAPHAQISANDIEKHDDLRIELLALIEDAVVAMRQKKSDLIERPTDRSSDRFCNFHNQYRSDEAKRLYKRDHAKREQFTGKIADLKSHYLREKMMVFRNNDVDAMMRLRKEAYELLHVESLGPKIARTPTKHRETIEKIDRFLAQGITNLSEIATQIGVTRAAVSIAIKRKVSKLP